MNSSEPGRNRGAPNAGVLADALLLCSLAVAGACEVQPDWSDIARSLQDMKATSSGGTDMTTGAAGTDVIGPTGTSGSTGMGRDGAGGMPTMGAGGDNASGGSPPGSAGTPVGSGGMGGGQGGTSVVADAGQDATIDKRATDLIELKDALKNLHGFTYTDPCKFSNNGTDVTTLAGCNTSDICWATMDLGRFAESRMIPIGGVAGHLYDRHLHVPGVPDAPHYPTPP